MKTLTLYTNPQSRGRIVRWMLEEIGAPYEIEVMEYGKNIKSPEYLAINPMGKVPAIKHGEQVVTEVAAICAYLADQFPDEHLAPARHEAQRGDYYRWLFFAAGPLEMALTAKSNQWNVDAENAISVGCGLIEDSINTIEGALKQSPYICGDNFTAADVVLSSTLYWAVFMKNLEPSQVLTDYINRCQSRPAAVRASELDDALMQ